MSKNRLQLDFSIESAKGRKDFLDNYLKDDIFKQNPLTETELDTCAKYLLYGKDEDGSSCVSRGEVQVDTKNKTWSKEHKTESLEFLMDREEGPGFDENTIMRPYQAHYKNVREIFSREEALHKAPEDLKSIFKDLFKQIDETELTINFYDIEHNKRIKEPRKELIGKFTEEEVKELKEKAIQLTQYQYLKKKHLLVELRRQQYTLRDSYDVKIVRSIINCGAPIEENSVFTFEFDAPVYPLGLFDEQSVQRLIFRPFDELYPDNYTEDDLKKISKLYWEKQKNRPTIYFDFTEMEHVYQLFLQYFELYDSIDEEELNSTTKFLFSTLKFYIDAAELSEVQKEVLDLKIKKIHNQDIALYINKKYQKNYTANYISTIFKQKIIKQINETAAFHNLIISNLFYNEEFKTCSCCGKTKLICPQNFVRKNRSKDGFTNRCKKCDKEDRNRKR